MTLTKKDNSCRAWCLCLASSHEVSSKEKLIHFIFTLTSTDCSCTLLIKISIIDTAFTDEVQRASVDVDSEGRVRIRRCFNIPLFCPPSFACPPACPPPLTATSPCLRAPKEVCLSQGGWRSMFLRRRARSIRIRIMLILFWFLEVGARSLCKFVLYHSLLLREKGGSRQFTVLKGTNQVFLRYRFGKYDTKKYQPSTDQIYQIGITLVKLIISYNFVCMNSYIRIRTHYFVFVKGLAVWHGNGFV
jgi:hypothetical protein